MAMSSHSTWARLLSPSKPTWTLEAISLGPLAATSLLIEWTVTSSRTTSSLPQCGVWVIDSGTTYVHLEIEDSVWEIMSCNKLVVWWFTSGNVGLVLPQEDCFYAAAALKGSLVSKCLLFRRMEDGIYNGCQRIGFEPMDCSSPCH